MEARRDVDLEDPRLEVAIKHDVKAKQLVDTIRIPDMSFDIGCYKRLRAEGQRVYRIQIHESPSCDLNPFDVVNRML